MWIANLSKGHVDSFIFISYPVVYFIIVAPITIIRVVSGFGSSPKTIIPPAATLATECIFSLSGLANVIIFLFTRSDLFIVGNTESKGHSFKATPLPPVNSSKASEMEETALQSHPQDIIPGVDDGGWTLPSAPHASESQELV